MKHDYGNVVQIGNAGARISRAPELLVRDISSEKTFFKLNFIQFYFICSNAFNDIRYLSDIDVKDKI